MNTKPRHAWERLINENFQWDILMGWVSNFAPQSEGEKLNLHWDPIVLHRLDLWKCTVPGVEHTSLKERRRWSTGLQYTVLVHLLMPGSAAFPSRHVFHVQPCHFLKAPYLSLSRAGGHDLFSTGMIIWLLSLSPPLVWRML